MIGALVAVLLVLSACTHAAAGPASAAATAATIEPTSTVAATVAAATSVTTLAPAAAPTSGLVPISTAAPTTLAPTTLAPTALAPATTTVAPTTVLPAAEPTTTAITTVAPPSAPTTPDTATSATVVPVVIEEDVAALPDGNGARIAIVVDDAGGVEGDLAGYLALPMPVTISIIPSFAHATDVAERTHAVGKEVLLHLPLANKAGQGDGVTRLNGTETADVVDRFVQSAVDRVPYAVGANNHEGPYGSAQPMLMRELLASLQRRGLFFMDSVTSQRSVGYAVEAELAMEPRVNNQFLDHDETDENSRDALIHLALLAARSGTGIGICHVFHPYALHALQAIGAQLQAKGYTFTVLSQVTNRLQGGLDAGMRAHIPAG